VSSDIVNSFRKKNVPSGSSGFTTFAIFVNAVYVEAMHVRTMMAIRIMNRQLLT
jgi:hypothetical protein